MLPDRRPIIVVGSINMDLVCRVRQMPAPGQTVMGGDLSIVPGGKGANQAVAAARLGGRVKMVGRVGEDDFGSRLLNGLQQHGVNTSHVQITEGVASGCAMILVDGSGENSIVVSPGANGKVTPADIDAAENAIVDATCVLVQLEIPMESVARACELARRHGVPVIVDPAPAPQQPLPASLLQADVLTPNETEAEALLHLARDENSGDRLRDPKLIAADLLAAGPGMVLLKLGARGALAMTRDGHIEQVDCAKVQVVDTTAAGDAFTAGYAVGLSENLPLRNRLRLATAAGSLTCTKFGAQPALPLRAEVDRLMARQ